MNKPFVFGTAVTGDNFIGRENESKRLLMNFTHGVNTILMSPRRWGKTSIVKRIIANALTEDVVIVYMDVFACRDEYEFCNKMAECVLKQTENKFEEWKNIAGEFITRLSPKISYSIDGGVNSYSVALGITPKSHRPEEIYQLPEVIAEHKKKHIIVCIDEFQQVGEFPDALSVQKRMRGVWQHQEHVSYCLFGSKKHMMEKLFLKKSYPFYRFGDIVPINPIEEDKWIPYIQKGFAIEKKLISEQLARKICQRVQLHPAYIQQYAWLTLVNTQISASDEILNIAYDELISENSALFASQTGRLTAYQMNFLRAILAGVHSNFATSAVREEFNLGSYSNISRIKAALEDAELIDTLPEGVFISDPVMEAWLRKTL